MTIRVLIADDEPHGRLALREFLDPEPDFEVVAECASGDVALERLRSTPAIDVAFLDIRMPQRTGIEVARAIGAEAGAPLLVFVTAFDGHALAAFEHFALDYVVKPVDPARFAKTLARIRSRRTSDDSHRPDFERLIEKLGASQHHSRIAVEAAGRTIFFEPGELLWAESRGNYVRIHGRHEAYTLRISLGQLAGQLESSGVVRIHRTHLVHSASVRELRSTNGGKTTSVLLVDGTELPVGRTYRETVARQLTERRR